MTSRNFLNLKRLVLGFRIRIYILPITEILSQHLVIAIRLQFSMHHPLLIFYCFVLLKSLIKGVMDAI